MNHKILWIMVCWNLVYVGNLLTEVAIIVICRTNFNFELLIEMILLIFNASKLFHFTWKKSMGIFTKKRNSMGIFFFYHPLFLFFCAMSLILKPNIIMEYRLDLAKCYMIR